MPNPWVLGHLLSENKNIIQLRTDLLRVNLKDSFANLQAPEDQTITRNLNNIAYPLDPRERNL
jgi:hypothetical protein